MSTLLLLLPDGPADASGAWQWLLADADGQLINQGRDPAATLPRAESLVLVPSSRAVSWLRATLPRTAPKRWRAALSGLLEEQLLDDPDNLHLALPAKANAGDEVWVAVTPLTNLQRASTALQAANRFVDRIAPAAWPLQGDGAEGHFIDQDGATFLQWRDAEGVAWLPLNGGFARSRLPSERLVTARWSAEPAAVKAAEAWLGQPVPMRSHTEQQLAALQSPWDLRQFDLAPRLHGVQRVRLLWHRFMQPDWRGLRYALVALAALNLVGLNALAFQQYRAEATRQAANERLFREAFPKNTAVKDAAAQLPRELNRLRASAGQPGPADLDTLLATAARSWPVGVAPLQALDFQGGNLTLNAADWNADQFEPFRQSLASNGLRVTQDDKRLVIQATP